MATITAAPDLAAGTVTLSVTFGSSVKYIIRADANGTRPVRTNAGTFPFSGTLTLTDYEPALTGPVQYRLYEPWDVEAAAEAWTTLEGGPGLPLFIIPSVPQYSAAAQLVTDYSAARETTSTFHQVINRPSPVVAQGRLAPRTGTLDIWVDTYAQGRDIDNIFARGQAVLYRQVEHAGMDMYLHGTRTNLTPDEEAWKLSVDYTEVDYPAGDVVALQGWTFDALAAAGGTFADVAGDYRSFLELAVGEEL